MGPSYEYGLIFDVAYYMDVEDEAFKLKALETALGILQDKKNKKNSEELSYVIDLLKEIEQQIKSAREEKIGTA